MHKCCICIYVCALHLCLVPAGGPKRMLDPLELELQLAVSHQCAGNQTQVWTAIVLTAETFLKPNFLILKFDYLGFREDSNRLIMGKYFLTPCMLSPHSLYCLVSTNRLSIFIMFSVLCGNAQKIIASILAYSLICSLFSCELIFCRSWEVAVKF